MESRRALEEQIRLDLAYRYGEVIGGDTLRLVLGYATLPAMNSAIRSKKLSLPTFFVEGRKGRFALTKEVANWIAVQRCSAVVDRSIPTNFKDCSK